MTGTGRGRSHGVLEALSISEKENPSLEGGTLRQRSNERSIEDHFVRFDPKPLLGLRLLVTPPDLVTNLPCRQ